MTSVIWTSMERYDLAIWHNCGGPCPCEECAAYAIDCYREPDTIQQAFDEIDFACSEFIHHREANYLRGEES